jgi:signal transduction histidine kinase
LAISIPGDEPNFILWFRPERLETVSWGGDPHKAVADDQGRIHPRKSFSAWTETVKGISAPWQPWETAAASQLRNAILSLELRRQLHREQVARAEAERATRLQKELMSVVSHDLKNPLTSIRLNLSLLQNKISTDAPVKYRSLFDSLDAASERMRRLVDDLLDVAKMESEGLQLDRASHFATQLVNDAIQIVEPIAVENKVILRRAQGGDSLRVWCDRDRILQVLLNLLSNAVKFTPAGGTVECSVAKSGAFVQFRITDTGEGIEPAHLPHIFDRFWQAKKNRMAGAGLGLAIVKGFVEAHGGSVDASSRLGEGSTFTFTLPRASP